MLIRRTRISPGAVLIVALFVAACSARTGSSGVAPPEVPAPVVSPAVAAQARPAVTAELLQSEAAGQPPMTLGTGAVVSVGLGVLQLNLQFNSAPEQGKVAAGLTFRSSRPDQPQTVIPDMRWVRPDRLEVRVPPGPAGEQLLLRLEAGLAAPFSVTLIRQAAVQYQFTVVGYPYRWPDERRTVLPVRVGTTTVEVVFSGPADRPSVEAAIDAALRPPPQSAPTPALQFHWETDRRLRIDLDGSAFAAATIDPGAALDQTGRSLARQLPLRLVWVPPTRLIALEYGGADPWVLASTYIKPVSALASPDGNWVAFLEQQGSGPGLLWLLDRQNGASRPLDTPVRDPRLLFWSPDSQSLVAGTPDRIVRIAVRGESPTVLYMGPYAGAAPSPDGQKVAVLIPRGREAEPDRFDLAILGATSHHVAAADLHLPRTGPTAVIPVSWHAEGRWMALGVAPSGSQHALLVSVAGTRRELKLAAPVVDGPLAWSPDGERLLAGSEVLEIQSGQAVRRLNRPVGLAHWSRDGSAVLIGRGDGAVDVVEFSRRNRAGTVTDLGAGSPAGWLPAGHMLIFR